MTLPHDLARRRTAEVTRRIALPPPATSMIVAPTAKRALAELKARQARGGGAAAGQLRLITMGPHAGQFGIPVELLPVRPDPVWALVLKRVGFLLIGVAAVLASLAWLVTAMSGAAVVTVCLVAGGLL